MVVRAGLLRREGGGSREGRKGQLAVWFGVVVVTVLLIDGGCSAHFPPSCQAHNNTPLSSDAQMIMDHRQTYTRTACLH